MKTLKDLFLDELADIYDAEQRIRDALPKLAKASVSTRLRQLFQSHLKETEGHLKKLEEVFGFFDQNAKTKTCEATKGLLEEAEKMIATFKDLPALDAALIAVGQKIEHYEIASYGCLRDWAEQLDHKKATSILQEILDEEGAANTSLTILARSFSRDNVHVESYDKAFKDMPADGEESAPDHLGIRPELQPTPPEK